MSKLFYSRAELSLQALHARDATQQQNQEYDGLHQHLTGLVQESQHYRGDVSQNIESAQSAAGPEIVRLPRRDEEQLREVRRHKKDGANFEASIIKESDKLRVPRIQDISRSGSLPCF